MNPTLKRLLTSPRFWTQLGVSAVAVGVSFGVSETRMKALVDPLIVLAVIIDGVLAATTTDNTQPSPLVVNPEPIRVTLPAGPNDLSPTLYVRHPDDSISPATVTAPSEPVTMRVIQVPSPSPADLKP